MASAGLCIYVGWQCCQRPSAPTSTNQWTHDLKLPICLCQFRSQSKLPNGPHHLQWRKMQPVQAWFMIQWHASRAWAHWPNQQQPNWFQSFHLRTHLNSNQTKSNDSKSNRTKPNTETWTESKSKQLERKLKQSVIEVCLLLTEGLAKVADLLPSDRQPVERQVRDNWWPCHWCLRKCSKTLHLLIDRYLRDTWETRDIWMKEVIAFKHNWWILETHLSNNCTDISEMDFPHALAINHVWTTSWVS